MDKKFLPVTREEMLERGWDQVDFVYVCGDAYVDHSSFGAAIITRVLEAHGYRIGMIAQPDWKDEKKYTGIWHATSGLYGVCGQHGLHGKSLYGIKEKEKQ